jgi:hypothetical protein
VETGYKAVHLILPILLNDRAVAVDRQPSWGAPGNDQKRRNSMRSNNAGCLTGAVTGFSRLFLIFAWLARPVLFNAAFGGWILPCLGILILPFTTLMYLILVQGVGTIQGIDWVWLILAVFVDIASIGAAGAANRDRIPQGYPGSVPPTPPTSY